MKCARGYAVRLDEVMNWMKCSSDLSYPIDPTQALEDEVDEV